MHEGVQQPVVRQLWPVGHIVPFGHIGQPGISVGLRLHIRVLGAAHAGQHEPPVHVLPAVHIVPAPHVRQTAPVESC